MPITHRIVDSNGIRMHVAEAGRGPLVLLLHGFPESWYSWRHQIVALSDAGYHVVAPDQRGYGQTDRPDAIEAYTIFHLVGDVIGLLDVLGEQHAVVIGHDWGAPVAWHTALFRPDRVRAVGALSVPYRPRGTRPPLDVVRELRGEGFYQIYFQKPGVAEADLERDVRATIRTTLFGASGQNPIVPDMIIRPGQNFLGASGITVPRPAWVSEQDVDYYTSEFERTGFTGGLSWYRNINRNWELTAPWTGAKITPPALFVVGDRDVVYHFPGGGPSMLDNLKNVLPNLRQAVLLEGCGHWTQQERPSDVNRLLVDFLQSL
jgi:pimeloyl-ACP methyl ester carboxylesterase